MPLSKQHARSPATSGPPSSGEVTFTGLIKSFGIDPDSKALTYYDESSGHCLTYGQLHVLVLAWMSYLHGELKLSPGARVVVCDQNGLWFPVIVLALIAMGATVVPVNPNADHIVIGATLKHADARVGMAATRVAPEALFAIRSGVDVLLTFDQLLPPVQPSARLPQVENDAAMLNRPALILYTSGTTGIPKGVVLSQRALVYNGIAMARNFGLQASTQLAVMPLFHAHAFGFGLMSALLTKGHLVLMNGLQPQRWKQAIQREQVAYTSLAPPLLNMLLRMKVTQADVPSLKGLLVSSAPLERDMARDFSRGSHIPLYHGWGLSEYTNFATCLRPETNTEDLDRLLFEEHTPSIGHALPGTEVSVRDDEGRPMAPGIEGELWVSGPSTMQEYFRNPQATDTTLIDGQLRSGDLGYWLDSALGPAFYVSGRIKEIIIRGGEKFSPIDIEARVKQCLPELPSGHYTVVGFKHRLYGEEIGLYISGNATMPHERILEALDALTPEIRPKIVLRGNQAIPMTHTGKIQRLRLSPFFSDYYSHSGPSEVIDVH